MKIFHSLNKSAPTPLPCAVTIGNFDGLHRGHQALIKRLKEKAPKTALITFSNNPSTILSPEKELCSIYTKRQKRRLLESMRIDYLYDIPFTEKLSKMSPEAFLKLLRLTVPLTCLLLGYNAVIGRNREGCRENLEKISKDMQFTLEYLPPYLIEGKTVSSSAIRRLVQEGRLKEASRFLGRPYSIYDCVAKGFGRGEAIGFATANLKVDGLCLPPFGVYAVEVAVKGSFYEGVANLGVAPTIRKEKSPLLEVHLIGKKERLYGEKIEVAFKSFLRKERRFASPGELSSQIAQDIEEAKRFFASRN